VNGHQLNGLSKQRGGASSPGQVTILVFVALFVLFLWLNFAMTQQIESTSREIQVKTDELRTIERQQKALLKEISTAGSEQRMAAQATTLGYRPQTPVYVAVAHALAQSTGDSMGNGDLYAAAPSGGRGATLPAYSLLAMLAGRLKAVKANP
jgi:hypothetical protein